ncbi:hypothetical protein [Catellatospora sp. NPDC049609]|uniref:hypothetical protein n=1 Tax=Catellatospora sp. NPDC049609 TaxID=3155505 RepID=UPI00342CE7D8
MVAGRWVLLVLMVLVGPLLWWGGVVSATSAAQAALPPGDSSLLYFLSNYRSGGLFMAGCLAFLNLLLIMILLPGKRAMQRGRPITRVGAVIGAMLITGLAWLEHWLNPVTYNWSGDPDAWSLAKDHVTPWHPALGTLWIVLNAAAAASIAVQAMVTTHRPADPPACR